MSAAPAPRPLDPQLLKLVDALARKAAREDHARALAALAAQAAAREQAGRGE